MLDLAGDPWRLAISPLELVLRSLAVFAVFLAVLEHDGFISIIQRDGPEVRLCGAARSYRTRGPSR